MERGGAGDAIAPLSSKMTPDERAVVREEEPEGSPPRAKNKSIEHSFGSDMNLLGANNLVAKSGSMVVQVAEVDAGPVTEGGQAEDEVVRQMSLVDKAYKRPRVDDEVSGSKSPPRITSDSSKCL